MNIEYNNNNNGPRGVVQHAMGPSVSLTNPNFQLSQTGLLLGLSPDWTIAKSDS